jgi:hypothetical protein
MPKKQQNISKNDFSSAPAAGGRAAGAGQRKSSGLHKRVLSAAHSLVRGVRSSKSINPARRTASAPQAKKALPLRRLPSPAESPRKRPLKPTKSPVAEAISHHALPFEPGEDHPDFIVQENAEAELPAALTDQTRPSPSPSPLEVERKEEHVAEKKQKEEAKNRDMLQLLEIERKNLKEATPENYHSTLKSVLRKIALHCNNISSDQVKTEEDWKGIAQILTDKLLGDFNPTLYPSESLPSESPGAAVAAPEVGEQREVPWQQDNQVNDDDSLMDFLMSNTTRNQEKTRHSDGSSPLLSLNSADFDLENF